MPNYFGEIPPEVELLDHTAIPWFFEELFKL